MSREPRGVVVPPSAPHLTLSNFKNFPFRMKKLPPDANMEAASNTLLYQFREKVRFGCVKCRRNNILSNTLAIDKGHRIILCPACFTRQVRPRQYQLSRVVPFPSLLSWLDYRPAQAEGVPEDISQRDAAAVLPSGDRVAAPQALGGSASARLNALPANAMNIATSNSGNTLSTAADLKHPCCRVWGVCQRGPACNFLNAPADLCLAYLMGLCSGGDTGPDSCGLLHREVFDLPPAEEYPHVPRFEGDIDDPETLWGRWVAARRQSPIQAERDLWNNGPVTSILDAYVPVTVTEENNEETTVAFDTSAILSALKSMNGPNHQSH